MIVRTWSARATRAGAADYHSYFAGTLLPALRQQEGFAGGYLLSRVDGGTVELTTHTFWESFDAIHVFAGDEPGRAVVEPEALAVLLEPDEYVTHREVLIDARP